MKIKQAKIQDFNEVYKLWKKAGLVNAGKKKEMLEYKLLIKNNKNTCLLVFNKQKVIASAFGAFNGRRAWIYHLAVDPSYQKKGIGSKLLAKVESNLKQLEATKIILGVDINNLATVPFYEKQGYQVMHDAVLFAKDLYKEKYEKSK